MSREPHHPSHSSPSASPPLLRIIIIPHYSIPLFLPLFLLAILSYSIIQRHRLPSVTSLLLHRRQSLRNTPQVHTSTTPSDTSACTEQRGAEPISHSNINCSPPPTQCLLLASSHARPTASPQPPCASHPYPFPNQYIPSAQSHAPPSSIRRTSAPRAPPNELSRMKRLMRELSVVPSTPFASNIPRTRNTHRPSLYRAAEGFISRGHWLPSHSRVVSPL